MAIPKPPCSTSPRSPNFGGYHSPRVVEAWVLHITDGVSSLGWLTSPQSQASANYLLDRDGTLHELVPPDQSPWTNGDVQKPDLSNPLIANWVRTGVNPNTRTLTCECEGKSTYGRPGSLTDAQEASLVALMAWGCDAYHFPADAVHLLRHRQINSVTRAGCPGFAEDEYDDYVARTAALLGGTSGGGDEVKEPAAGTASQYLNQQGQAILVINMGGQATTILGANYADVGVTVRNNTGDEYSRSLQQNTMQPWQKTN